MKIFDNITDIVRDDLKELGRLTRRYVDMPRYVRTFQTNDVALVSIDDGSLFDSVATCL